MLYIAATPIGNLDDISARALRIFREVDFILAEDTRVTKKLLDNYEIETQMISYFQHSSLAKVDKIIELLKSGKKLALVTDAGTPGISDPGNKLISQVLEKQEVEIVSIPGPSAVTAALSISGMPTDKFVFMGFPPHKKGREKYFKEVLENDKTVVFYESCHRIIKCLNQLIELGGWDRRMVVCRELTKKFESVYRGSAREVLEKVESDPVKGEYVVIVGK